MKTILFVTAILVFIYPSITSCKKAEMKNQENIRGIVVTFPSKQPVPGTKVFLRLGCFYTAFQNLSPNPTDPWKINFADTMKLGPYYILDSVITDSNGYFSLNTPTNDPVSICPNHSYSLAISDPDKFIVFQSQQYLPGNFDSIYIDKPSYFRLNMNKNTLPNINDTLFEKRIFLNNSNHFFPPLRTAQIGQTNVTLTDTFSYNLSSKVYVEWRYYRNGLITSGKDTINLIPHSTTELNINY